MENTGVPILLQTISRSFCSSQSAHRRSRRAEHALVALLAEQSFTVLPPSSFRPKKLQEKSFLSCFALSSAFTGMLTDSVGVCSPGSHAGEHVTFLPELLGKAGHSV